VILVGGSVSNVLIDRSVESATRAMLENRLSYEATMLGQMTAGALFGQIDPSDKSLEGPVRSLGESVHTRLAVLANNGVVVADSAGLVADPGAAKALDPELEDARLHGRGQSYRDGQLYVAVPIERDGSVLGYARGTIPVSEIAHEVNEVRVRIVFGAVVGLCLALLFGAIVSGSLSRPIRAVSEGARRVGGGDFGHRIRVESEDDIGKLAVSFNEMTGSLERTVADLDRRNADVQRVLDSVDQALLTLDAHGVIAKERSATVDRWFGLIPAGTRFADLLARFDPRAATAFECQWDELCANLMPVEVLLDQLPKLLSHGEKRLAVEYTLIGAAEGPTFPELLLVVTDVTARLAAERAEAEQREIAALFERTMRDKAAMVEFLMDAEARVRALTSEVRPPIADTKRSLHTLKGNAGACGMQRLAALCHAVETRMAEDGPDLSRADRAALGEDWSRLAARISTFVGSRREEIVIDDQEYAAVLRALVDGSPRYEVLRIVREWKRERVIPRLEHLAASARDLAQRLDKGDLAVEIAPSPLRTPREEWAPFWATLTHVVRNAVDHGIETAEERARAGKLERPCISLSAVRLESEVIVDVRDNGKGVDWLRIAERADSLGLPADTPDQLVDALFSDGVSSRTLVTATSGRGVGLGAARDACERIGGYVTVETELGRGTLFRFHFPVLERSLSLPPAIARTQSWPGYGQEQKPLVITPDGVLPTAAMVAQRASTLARKPPSHN